jgi:DNA-binding NarL/FixJ family response regulator
MKRDGNTPSGGEDLGKAPLAEQASPDPGGNGKAEPSLGILTPAEARILGLILDGKSNREIAALLHRSERTVEVHRSRVMGKLGVHNLVDLVKKVYERNLDQALG